MIVIFEKEYLRELYYTGKTNDKKCRFQQGVVKSYKRAIDTLQNVVRKEELFRFNSLHFESLRGDKVGLYSVRAGLQYRIEFRIDENENEPMLTICNIVELSNHYD